MSDQVLIHDVLSCFLVEETTRGTAEEPTAADAVVLRGEGIKFPTQPQEYSKGREALNTRSVTVLAANLRGAGSVTLPTFLRPSGTAGTAPGEDKLLAALLPSKTVTPVTSVVYEPSADKPSQTLWLKTSNGVLFCVQCAVHGLKLSRSEDGFAQVDWELSFQRLGWAGESILSAALSGGEATITVDDPEHFSVGARIKVGDSDGHMVTSVDYDTGAIGVTPVIVGAQADESAVTASLPTPTAVGAPLAARPAVKIDGTAIKWKSVELTFSETIAWVKEVSEDPSLADYPGDFVARAREVAATVRAVMRTSDLQRLRAQDTDRTFSIDWSAQAAGKRVVFLLGQGRVRVPELEAGDPTVEFSLGFDAKASAAFEDELTVTYS
jgi:hypothetical protein